MAPNGKNTFFTSPTFRQIFNNPNIAAPKMAK